MKTQNDSPTITFDGLNVTYERKIGDMEIEIEGKLYPYNDGRKEGYRFTNDYCADVWSQDFFDNNWEEVEQEVINEYYRQMED